MDSNRISLRYGKSSQTTYYSDISPPKQAIFVSSSNSTEGKIYEIKKTDGAIRTIAHKFLNSKQETMVTFSSHLGSLVLNKIIKKAEFG